MLLSVQSAGLVLRFSFLLGDVCEPDVDATSVARLFRDCLGVWPVLVRLLLFCVHVLLCFVVSIACVLGRRDMGRFDWFS